MRVSFIPTFDCLFVQPAQSELAPQSEQVAERSIWTTSYRPPPRGVLVLGLFYTLSVFVTYYLIGLGFLSAIRYAHSFYLFARIIHWTLVAVLVVLAALSFAGLSLKILTAVFQKRMALVKLALVGLFAALAVLTVVM